MILILITVCHESLVRRVRCIGSDLKSRAYWCADQVKKILGRGSALRMLTIVRQRQNSAPG
jgi:hypothetical protein